MSTRKPSRVKVRKIVSRLPEDYVPPRSMTFTVTHDRPITVRQLRRQKTPVTREPSPADVERERLVPTESELRVWSSQPRGST